MDAYFLNLDITSHDNHLEVDQDNFPVMTFIEGLLEKALIQRASDIHFELHTHTYQIRYRIDGLLHVVMNPPRNLANRITACIKVMANLDVSERRLPQDGHFTVKLHKRNVDCRISVCPTLHGEKVVIRILNTELAQLHLKDLHLNASHYHTLIHALQQPQGLILVTGPTGSGKTTTLYAAINHLNQEQFNISTIEDPVEIDLPGINQINVHPKIGLNFATLLRTLLRQDPDIMMIGEIRDAETAELAVQAAQTGHLVLATLHTNSTLETYARLINLGVSKFNLADTLHFIIGQRLVRRLCQRCKKIHNGFLPDALNTFQHLIYQASGCEQCHRGYLGRLGLFEMLSISPTFAHMLITHRSSKELKQQAKRDGLQTLFEDGMQKIKLGLTSVDEIERVFGLNIVN